MKEHLKVALIMAACLSANVTVASPMNIVGSSTVYPFSKLVADVLTTKGVIAAPKFSVTGSGKGIQLFCDSNSSQSPDITNASRRIKISELKRCQDHGVHVSEMMIGYDGIVIAGSLNSIPMKLSRKDLFLALAQQVPNVLNNGLIPNPYIYWDDLNPNLAHRIIRIIGSPKGTGTRDTFEQKVMHVVSREIPLYSKNNLYKYHEFRQDGVFISDGEDHERSIKVIESDMNALAIFGYHFFHKNKNDLKVATVDGFSPTPSNISNMNYPALLKIKWVSKIY